MNPWYQPLVYGLIIRCLYGLGLNYRKSLSPFGVPYGAVGSHMEPYNQPLIPVFQGLGEQKYARPRFEDANEKTTGGFRRVVSSFWRLTIFWVLWAS